MGWSAAVVAQTAGQAPSPVVVTANTEADEQLELGFTQLGVIEKVHVKDGQVVKAGEALVSQDDFVDRQELESLRIDAESQSRMEAVKADLAQKKVVRDRKVEMRKNNVASDSEVEEAELAVLVAEKTMEVRRDEQLQAKAKYEGQKRRVERMHLKSPVDGVVVQVTVGPGEVTEPDAQRPAVIVVANNPLKVVVRSLRASQVKHLSMGQELEVRYADEQDWQKAKVVYISPQVDPASDTQLVKLELDNSRAQKASGLSMVVKLPDAVANPKIADAASARR